MSSNLHRLPSSRVLKACRCLGGVGGQGSLRNAVRTVSAALADGITTPRSAVLDLARIVFDAEVDIDRTIRTAAAKDLSAFNEREIVSKATRAIRDPSSPLDVVTAAAVILLGSPNHPLPHRTRACLVRKVRKFGQIRGPLVALLQSTKLPTLPNKRAKK